MCFPGYSYHKQFFLFIGFASIISAPPLEKSWLLPWELLHLTICLSNLYTRCEARADSPLRERGKSLQFVKDLKGARLCGGVQIEELIAVFNHDDINVSYCK